MALARKYQKIFGKNAQATDLSVVGSKSEDNPQYSVDVETLQSLSNWESGMRSIVTSSSAPYLEDHNSLFYVITSQLAYLFQAGIAEWNSQTEYVANRSVVLRNGKIYVAVANNTNVEPEVTANWNTYWKSLIDWGFLQGNIYNQSDLWQLLLKGVSYNGSVSTAIGGYPQGAILRFFDGDASYLVSSLVANNTEAPSRSNIKFKESDADKKWKCLERVVVKADRDVDGNWYRLYNDGWIEQGGIVNGSSVYNNSAPITFTKTMSDTNYFVSIFAKVGRIRCGSGGDHVDIGVGTTTTAGVTVFFGGSDSIPSKICWKVEGYISEE